MNLEQRLRENILRFGTKNLNENIKIKLLLESDPNEFDPNDSEIPGDVDPEDASVNDKLPVGQRIKQTAKKVGKVTKDVVVAASIVGLLSKVIRNRLFKRYMRKNGIPTKEELIAKDSDRVKSHPAYQQTIDLMYRDKRTMKSASRYNVEGAKQTAGLPVLYWYGVPALGGETNPQDELNSKNMIAIAKVRSQRMADEIGEYTDDATKQEFTSLVNNFINGLQELDNSGIYITASDLLNATEGNSGATPIHYFLNRLLYGSDPEYTFMRTADEIRSIEQANNTMQVTKKLKNFLSAIKLGVADSGISPKGEKLRDLEIEATSTLTLSDEDKLGILTMFQEESEAAGKPIIDATYWDIEAASIGIKTNKALETTTVKGKKGPVVVTYEFFTIPNDPNSDEAKTAFFGNNDDKTNLNPDSISSMNNLLNKLIAQANKSGQQVVSVQYCAGAKTSAVGTTFGMTAKAAASAGEDEKTEANINLANSRCANILKAINEQVLPTVKSQPNMGDDKVSYGTVTAAVGGEKGIFAYPNCGPGWYEYSASGTGHHKGTGYGPIFNNLYKILKENNPKVNGYALFPYYGIPRWFYICRNTPKAYERLSGYITSLKNSDPKKYGTLQVPSQQQIEAEYQSVYSPFRGTYAGFLIGTMVATSEQPKQEVDKALEVEIEKFGEFEAMIDWTNRFVKIATEIGDGIGKFFGNIGRLLKKIEFPDIPKGAVAFPSGVQHLCNAYD